MILQALETFSESKKRKEVARIDAKPSRKRFKKTQNSGTNALTYLRETGEKTKFQEDGTWVKKAKVWNKGSPTTSGRKATAREHETN